MTYRQVFGLLEVIGEVGTIEFYNTILSYDTALKYQNQKLPSLAEFLALSSGEDEPNTFDEKTDKLLEEHALKKFTEGTKKHGK